MSDVKIYSINFWAEGVNFGAIQQYLYDSSDIIAYWNYIPLLYCVKSNLSSTELAEKLSHFIPSNNFLVAQIDRSNMNGVLPQSAWDWFYLEHHQKINPPNPYANLAITAQLAKK